MFTLLRASSRLRWLLRELRSVSGLTWVSLVLLLLVLMFRSWLLVGALCVAMTLNLLQWIYFRYLISHAGLNEVDDMSGWEFEKWIRRFLEQLGFEVQTTPYRGDFGADLIATWNGVRTVVQVKRSSRPVGVRAVQEVTAAKAYYGCERAMVVTNSGYTEQALILARANGVVMRTRDDLAKKLSQLQGTAEHLAMPGRTTAVAESNSSDALSGMTPSRGFERALGH